MWVCGGLWSVEMSETEAARWCVMSCNVML